ncbi:LptA/OstA family protein [Primorskyibacter marinus]|uniref:LptA/OstA family protein n=1 Tax=Primorskyibacter marinus TaxID=1977320 RepID=UPI000E3061D0|nr:LptA/OstA family protein [Primorskyibacter marinus]
MLPIRPALLALALILPLPVYAQGANVAFGASRDSSGPVEVTADNLSVNQSDGTALYTGNVIIGQGDMRLAAPRVLVVFAEDNSKIDRLEATGGVTLVSGEDAAEAERADYDIDGGTIDMAGNVLLTQGPSAVTSERMRVDLDAGTAQMSGRVKTILQDGDQ